MIHSTVEKRLVRKQIKQLKASISSEDRNKYSLLIFSKIESDEAFIKANKVLLYWSLDDEVNTHNFVQKYAFTKDIFLPVIDGDSLVLRKFTSVENMTPDPRFGILEPNGDNFYKWSEIKYAIIPGVAFDINNNRLGRGKGFYDRILNNINALKVGVCFDFQIIDRVPIESNDVKMDKVFSNK